MFTVAPLDLEVCVVGVDCYPAIYSVHPTPVALLTSNPSALAVLRRSFQALFDSGCTHHIIKDCSHFWTYHPEGAVPVGTASSGTLFTKARGIVKIHVHTEQSGMPVTLTLHDCLHGPKSPFNLLSVGAFLEANMPVNFQTNGVAMIQLPSNQPTLQTALLGRRYTVDWCSFLANSYCPHLLPMMILLFPPKLWPIRPSPHANVILLFGMNTWHT